MVVEVRNWFPTPIYMTDEFSKERNEVYRKRALEIREETSRGAAWYCNTYNTLGTYDCTKDKVFQPLVKEVTRHCNLFAGMHGSSFQYGCAEAWVNINEKGSYQEYHTHPYHTFSAVYYISVPEGSGMIQFESPYEPDMLPVKNIRERTELSYLTCDYGMTDGTLIIFRSNLRHMVRLCENTEPRISIAFNF